MAGVTQMSIIHDNGVVTACSTDIATEENKYSIAALSSGKIKPRRSGALLLSAR
jgi:hypothetical protein